MPILCEHIKHMPVCMHSITHRARTTAHILESETVCPVVHRVRCQGHTALHVWSPAGRETGVHVAANGSSRVRHRRRMGCTHDTRHIAAADTIMLHDDGTSPVAGRQTGRQAGRQTNTGGRGTALRSFCSSTGASVILPILLPERGCRVWQSVAGLMRLHTCMCRCPWCGCTGVHIGAGRMQRTSVCTVCCVSGGE
jgi:hypothetical protein